MGTHIDAIAMADPGWLSKRSGRKLADAAAEACLEQAGLEADDIDLLVNAGIYHEHNMGEPALAALLQEDIGANPEDPHGGAHGTFSFDIANGTCGVLTSFEVADGFLRAGTISHALVVASDASPGHRFASHFPYEPAGAAALLSWSEEPDGLVDFRWETSPDDDVLFRATVGFEDGHNLLRIVESPEFAERIATWAGTVGTRLLADRGLVPDDVDLVIAAPATGPFLEALSAQLGVPAERVIPAHASPHTHTVGLLSALHEAQQAGRLRSGQRVLLVAAGAGITAGAALLLT